MRFVLALRGKFGDLEAAPQERLSVGKGQEASRATKFLNYLAASAHGLAGIAICMDFARKMGDFEAACQ